MEISYCKTENEIKQLAELAEKIWNEYFVSIITKQQIDYMVHKFQSFEALKYAIQEDHYIYFTMHVEDELIGYCGVKPEEDGRLFLSKLYLEKSNRGHGYASIMLNEVMQLAKQLNLHAIYLTCNKYNTHSLEVYKKKGFHQIDAVQTDIGEGYIMDDYILQLDLN